MSQFYIDRVIQLALLDHIFQFTGGGRFTEILVVFGPMRGSERLKNGLFEIFA